MSRWISVISLVACLQASLVVSQTQAPIYPPVTPICGLSGYDIPLLYEVPYWSFAIPSKNECPIPINKTIGDVQNCTIFFAICQPLNNTICQGYDDSSVCIEVTLNDNTKDFYSVGSYNAFTEFFPVGNSDNDKVDGFGAILQGSKFGAQQCVNGTAASIITFKCDESIKWDPNGTRVVTDYVISAAKLPVDPCFYNIRLKYSGACYISPTLQPSRCYLDNYDVKTLASREFWIAPVSPSLCIGEDHISCSFVLAFCHDIAPTVGVGCYGSSVCQVGELPNTNVVEYSMGMFVSNETHFVENVDDVGGGFHMDVQNGSKPENLTNINCTQYGIRTRVILVCNSSAKWERSDISEFLHVAYDENQDPCMYNLVLDYNGACTPVFPIGSDVSNILGGVFFGVLAFVVIVYLAIGSAYQFFVKKERGIRILPNYDFWKTFLMLVLEGCKFFLDIITCFQFNGQVKKAPTVGKVDYDKI